MPSLYYFQKDFTQNYVNISTDQKRMVESIHSYQMNFKL